MSFNVHTVMPSGAISRGYDRKTEDEATKAFDRVFSILKTWKAFTADVVITDEQDKELRREHVENV